jgi:uncharacterized protein (DUF1810 family)
MADLERFVEAQERVYPIALAELQRGRKESHWMWFVFPQIAGLGFSPTAQYYAIGSEGEARAYLGHPLLGPRLEACARAVLAHRDLSPEAIFGGIDALKFRSSMTLFEAAADGGGPYGEALDAFYDGERDDKTLRLLGRESG